LPHVEKVRLTNRTQQHRMYQERHEKLG